MIFSAKFYAFIGLALLAAPGAMAEGNQAEKIQAALEAWVEERAAPEKVTGIAAYVSFGDPGPALEAFAGKIGRDPHDRRSGRIRCFRWAARRSLSAPP